MYIFADEGPGVTDVGRRFKFSSRRARIGVRTVAAHDEVIIKAARSDSPRDRWGATACSRLASASQFREG